MMDTIQPEIQVARCYEIQTALGNRSVPEFGQLTVVGMTTKVALHIRGLPLIDYETLKLICANFLDIPSFVLERIVGVLAEIEFIYPVKDGETISLVLPNAPFHDELYTGLREYLETELSLTEAEQLALTLSPATKLGLSMLGEDEP